MQNIRVLSLSKADWSGQYWASRQCLTYELARHACVVYATERLPYSAFVRALTSRRPNPPFSPPPSLGLLRPLLPRIYRFSGIERRLFRAHIKRLQRSIDVDKSAIRVVYAWEPSFANTVVALDYDVLVYHPYDMFRHFTWANEQLVRDEELLCELADAVVTPHQKVADALQHANAHVIGNGIFMQAFPDFREIEPISEIADLPRPVIGYIGAVNDKVDYQLLLNVFSQRPDWSLAIVGSELPGSWNSSVEVAELRALENVHFCGAVPFNEVSRAIGSFDVGIIPYSLSGWARFSESPLKLSQYWAMGVPVVCSELPNLESTAGALEICRSSADWILGIERQLAGRTGSAKAHLRDRALKRDWSVNARKIIEIIRAI